MGKREKKKKKPLGLGRWIVLIICAIVFCGCGAYLGLYAKDKVQADHGLKKLKAEEGVDFEGLYAKNHDFIGWVCVDGTKIDYPVMQTKEDPEFYLHRDFDKEWSESGTPFLDASAEVSPEPTWDWLIYGHNMKFGTMFHDLLEYASVDFWKEHSTFTFDVYSPETGVIEGEFEIFAAARSKIREKGSNAFKYYQYSGYTDEETFNEFVAGVRSEALYDTGITPQYGDQLVTLSTCAYHTDNGRFYIVGRKIR